MVRSLLVALLLAACGSEQTPSKPMPMPSVDMPAEATAMAKASNQLAFALWAKTKTPGNLAMSPASVDIALAMTWGGAKGATADEMRETLHLTGDPDAVMTAWGKLAAALQDPRRPLKLRIANRLFGDKAYKFEQPFLDKTKAAYGAPLESLDFRGAPDAARKRINTWVEDQTEKRIKDLLPADSIKPATRLVLVNAIYFLADWLVPFEKEATSPEPFAITPANKQPVPTMHQMKQFRLAKADGMKLLELPYKGDNTAMWIALPDKLDGLAALEQSLNAATFERWQAALAPQMVNVSLPKFTIDPPSPLALAPALQELGMVQAFDDKKADFYGIAVPPTPEQRLYISQVFHKAFVKVDEKGTEAAAATAVVMAEGAGMPPPAEEFKADHPFLFFIVDKPSGLILFMGRVAEPKP